MGVGRKSSSSKMKAISIWFQGRRWKLLSLSGIEHPRRQLSLIGECERMHGTGASYINQVTLHFGLILLPVAVRDEHLIELKPIGQKKGRLP
jgi:hypothetical protein